MLLSPQELDILLKNQSLSEYRKATALNGQKAEKGDDDE